MSFLFVCFYRLFEFSVVSVFFLLSFFVNLCRCCLFLLVCWLLVCRFCLCRRFFAVCVSFLFASLFVCCSCVSSVCLLVCRSSLIVYMSFLFVLSPFSSCVSYLHVVSVRVLIYSWLVSFLSGCESRVPSVCPAAVAVVFVIGFSSLD